MSMLGGMPREHGEKIADYASYEGAQKAVSQLIEKDIPAKDIAIVGRGLRSVETVTGRLGYAAAARTGAVNGILLGLLFSAIVLFGTPQAAIQLFLGVMLVGIALGMLMSIISYAIVRRRRDFASVTQVIADRYELTVLPRSIHRAREIVGHRVAPAAATPAAAAIAEEPPRYGERIGSAAPAPHRAPAADGADAERPGDGSAPAQPHGAAHTPPAPPVDDAVTGASETPPSPASGPEDAPR